MVVVVGTVVVVVVVATGPSVVEVTVVVGSDPWPTSVVGAGDSEGAVPSAPLDWTAGVADAVTSPTVAPPFRTFGSVVDVSVWDTTGRDGATTVTDPGGAG